MNLNNKKCDKLPYFENQCLHRKLGNKVIYMFDHTSCNSCFIDDVIVLNQLSDSVGSNNILMISNFESEKIRKAFKHSYNLKFCLISCSLDLERINGNRSAALIMLKDDCFYKYDMKHFSNFDLSFIIKDFLAKN